MTPSHYAMLLWYLIIQKLEYIPHTYRLVEIINSKWKKIWREKKKNLEEKKHEIERQKKSNIVIKGF